MAEPLKPKPKIRVELNKAQLTAQIEAGNLDMYVGRDSRGWFADLSTSVGMISGKSLGDILRKLAEVVDGVAN